MDQTTVRAVLSCRLQRQPPASDEVGMSKPEFAVQKRYATPNEHRV
jgi:hypothetical protein